MDVVLYGRVSSERQDVDLSIASQLRALREYAAAHGHTVVREFTDEAETGRTAKRPVFQEMISLARRKAAPFQAILVWKLSRFARNREDSILYKSLLRRQGVQVISINEPIEHSPTGAMMEGIIEVLDEFYSSNLAQEVTRGMREAVSRGFWVQSTTPFGYQRVHVKDGAKTRAQLSPDPVTSPTVREIFALAESGLGVKEIAKTLNDRGLPSPRGKRWGKSRVHAMLTSPVYVGTLEWGVSGRYHREANIPVIRVEGAIPALVDQATFARVEASMKSRAPAKVHPRRVGSAYLLSGIAFCGNCGALLGGQSAKSGRFHYYVCGTASRTGKSGCSAKPVPQPVLEKGVVRQVQQIILREEHLTELVRLTNEEITAAQQETEGRLAAFDLQIAELDRRLDRLYAALETGKLSIDDLAPRIRALREQGDQLVQGRAGASAADATNSFTSISTKQVVNYVHGIEAVLATGTIGERQAFLRSFVRSITVAEGAATVEYTLPIPPESPGADPVLSTVSFGGPAGIRTPDLLNAIEARSQLRHRPTREGW
jgi:site-specific DNA recombinase